MRRKKRRHGTRLLILLSALVVLGLWLWWGNISPVTTVYPFADARVPEGFDGFRIAQISDLHDARLGPDNAWLLQETARAKPDVIVITGDAFDAHRVDLPRSLSAIEGLRQIAPVYYVTGNHEAARMASDYRTFRRALKEMDVTVLEDAAAEIRRGGDTLTVVGMQDIGFHEGGYTQRRQLLQDRLTALVPVEGFSLTLAHRPELIDCYEAAGAPLVFCGHAHGGQVRLPFIGGLAAPGQGLFPKYTAGIYRQGNTAMVVSRGIGNSVAPLRVNNRPEIVLLELRRESQ